MYVWTARAVFLKDHASADPTFRQQELHCRHRKRRVLILLPPNKSGGTGLPTHLYQVSDCRRILLSHTPNPSEESHVSSPSSTI